MLRYGKWKKNRLTRLGRSEVGTQDLFFYMLSLNFPLDIQVEISRKQLDTIVCNKGEMLGLQTNI